MGAYFRGSWKSFTEIPVIGDVRGKGLMLALETGEGPRDQGACAGSSHAMLERTRDNGLLIGKGGLYSNVIRLSPMLNIAKSGRGRSGSAAGQVTCGSTSLTL